MKKEKVRFLQIYNTLSNKEQKEFKQFASINLFGNSRSYKDFFENLKQDKTGRLNFSKDFKDRTISNRLTELTKLIQTFLVMKNLQSNDFSFELSLLDELKNRKLTNYFDQRIKLFQKSISSKITNKDKLQYQIEFNRFIIKNEPEKGLVENPDIVFHDTIDLSSILFVIEYLEFRIREIVQHHGHTGITKTFSNVLAEQIDFEKILSLVKIKFPEYHSLTSFYYYMFKSFSNLDETYNYHIVRKIFMNDLKSDSRKDNNIFYDYLISYNIIKNYYSKKVNNQELFLLINMKIESGLFIEEFKNENNSIFIVSVMTSLALGRLDWTGNFIEKFGMMLPENIRESKIYFSKAFLSFYKKDFVSCKNYSEMIDKKNPFTYINATKLILQSCYELDKIEECYVVLKRLQEYIRMHNAITELNKFGRDFCWGFALLLKLKDDPVGKNHLKVELEMKSKDLNFGDWLNNKLSEIIITL